MSANDIKSAIAQIVKGQSKQLLVPDLDVNTGDLEITTRDFIREAFQENGIEVEFSGKGAFEKGVVIDIDEEVMQQLGLNPDVLRFGQTVVRVGGN